MFFFFYQPCAMQMIKSLPVKLWFCEQTFHLHGDKYRFKFCFNTFQSKFGLNLTLFIHMYNERRDGLVGWIRGMARMIFVIGWTLTSGRTTAADFKIS